MWQIGVAVTEAGHDRGICRAIVGHLTEGILARGKIPDYSTAVSNIRSRAVASSRGYRPVWTELYAKDR
jgi:predicted GNAT family acetyltransferase